MSLDMILYMEKVSNRDTIVNMVRSMTRVENYERSLRKVQTNIYSGDYPITLLN